MISFPCKVKSLSDQNRIIFGSGGDLRLIGANSRPPDLRLISIAFHFQDNSPRLIDPCRGRAARVGRSFRPPARSFTPSQSKSGQPSCERRSEFPRLPRGFRSRGLRAALAGSVGARSSESLDPGLAREPALGRNSDLRARPPALGRSSEFGARNSVF